LTKDKRNKRAYQWNDCSSPLALAFVVRVLVEHTPFSFNRSRTHWVPAILQAGSLEHFACSSNSSHPSRLRTCTGAVPAEAYTGWAVNCSLGAGRRNRLPTSRRPPSVLRGQQFTKKTCVDKFLLIVGSCMTLVGGVAWCEAWLFGGVRGAKRDVACCLVRGMAWRGVASLRIFPEAPFVQWW